MRRNALTLALAALSGLAVSTVVAHADSATPIAISASSIDRAPQSRIEGDAAMDGAVAAAVIGAIAEQFGDRKVEVKLDSVDVAPASLRDRTVAGHGRLRIGADRAWIPFRFATLYDTSTTTVSYPRLVLGDSTAGEQSSPDSQVAQSLWGRVDASLRSEFEQQPLQLALDRVMTHPSGNRYLRVEAAATVDFGADGSTPARVDALYDRQSGTWVRVDYELGETANWDAVRPMLAAAD